MSDIVERMKKIADECHLFDVTPENEHLITARLKKILLEAADEIERLRSLAGAVSHGYTHRAVRDKIVSGMAKNLGVKLDERNG